MTNIFSKFKSLIAGIMVFSFFIGITMNSCTSDKKSGKSEKMEAASESEEHPSGGEHPEGEEHPAGDEHPSDSTKQEHPSN